MMLCIMSSRYLTSCYMQAVGTFLFANHFYSFALKFYKNCEREVAMYAVYLAKISLVNWDVMHIGGHFSLVNMAILSVRFS